MFNTLSDKFNSLLRQVSGRGRISEANVRDAMAEVRTALLEADVHYEVAQTFCDRVLEQALGTAVLESLKPGQQMIKIVYDELVRLIGGEDDSPGIMLVDPGPTIVMMSGLQGSGKTTTCGKLGALLKKRGQRVMLAAADLQRPAAVHQLQVLAEQVQQQVKGKGEVLFYGEPDKVAEYGKAVGVAVSVARRAVDAAKKQKCDVLILDTAGRLHINDALMGELRQVEQAVHPHQILLVIDAMTGQDAVNSAKAFNEQLELDGVILTKFDSDTRGGAALSVKHITGKPIKYLGIGEKLDALEEFHPDRVASRILGMGDVISLVEKAQEQVSADEAAALQEKLAKGKMTMDDFLGQLKMMRRMGSLKSLLGMLPGIGTQLQGMDLDESQIDRTEAIIHSMTPAERKDVDLLDNSRRRRVSRGSGTSQQEVGQLVRGFEMVAQMGKQMTDMNMLSRLRSLSQMGSMDLSRMGSRGGGMPALPGARAPKRGFKDKFKQRRRKSR